VLMEAKGSSDRCYCSGRPIDSAARSSVTIVTRRRALHLIGRSI